MSAPQSQDLGGLGQSVKRKEDARFIRGQGKFVDDVQLRGMVYMKLVRSPYAHARLGEIDSSGALALPGVLAVITGEDLAASNLAWMPTLSGDQQMVLATGKVLFQGQEVAAVVGETRFAAADGAAAVRVEYEELPVLVDPHRALDRDAPLLREDREEKTNHIFHWEAGDGEATERIFSEADVTVSQDIVFQRCHPAPIECCGCVADVPDKSVKASVQLVPMLAPPAPASTKTTAGTGSSSASTAKHSAGVIPGASTRTAACPFVKSMSSAA